MLNEDDARFLKGLQDELNSQPTLGTADPRFWVVMSKHWEPCFGDDEPDGAFVDGDPERIDDIAEEVYRVLEEDEGEDAADAWALSYDVRMPSEGVFDFRGCTDDLFEEYARVVGGDVTPAVLVERAAENTMFLTLREAEEHIAANSYHYIEPRPFCMCAWRSPQVERLVNVLRTADFSCGPENAGDQGESLAGRIKSSMDGLLDDPGHGRRVGATVVMDGFDVTVTVDGKSGDWAERARDAFSSIAGEASDAFSAGFRTGMRRSVDDLKKAIALLDCGFEKAVED